MIRVEANLLGGPTVSIPPALSVEGLPDVPPTGPQVIATSVPEGETVTIWSDQLHPSPSVLESPLK